RDARELLGGETLLAVESSAAAPLDAPGTRNLQAASVFQLAEEVGERIGEHLAHHERDRVAKEAAAHRVVDGLVDPAAERLADRGLVPSHLGRSRRGREREDELLARCMQRACGAIEAGECDALHGGVDRAEETALVESRLRRARICDPALTRV